MVNEVGKRLLSKSGPSMQRGVRREMRTLGGGALHTYIPTSGTLDDVSLAAADPIL